MRRTATVLVALALAAGTPAHATTCPLVTDPTGDVFVAEVRAQVAASRHLDIVSVDVASGPTTVVAVLRVAGLAGADPTAVVSPYWMVNWVVDGEIYRVLLTGGYPVGPVAPSGWFYREADVDVRVPAPVVVDEANGTVTWTLPRSWFPELATPGATFGKFYAQAGDFFTHLRDEARAPAGRTWTDGTTGCVAAA